MNITVHKENLLYGLNIPYYSQCRCLLYVTY